ncbi:MAG: DNA replication/repair protein RecF [Anaerolineales bacterium]|jgi:DNA replication and repair protein RecF|nr:DNA replication/repair protein RecF [Anaerolineales bacterium]
MHIGDLSLTNFRNYRRFEAQLPSGPLILVGRNAQGKTSLMEAIHYLVSAHSLHAHSDRQLINWLALREETQPFLRIIAQVLLANEMRTIEVRLEMLSDGMEREPRLKKTVLIDGLKQQVRALSGVLNVVMFLPQDMVLVEGSPGDRRRFLDATISQVDSIYANSVREYTKVLAQRNALLKSLRERTGAADQIEYWDEALCAQGATLMARRARALDEIEQYASALHQELTTESEHLRLAYRPSYAPADQAGGQLELGLEVGLRRANVPEAELAAGMRARLRELRREEIQRGMTLVGPHRDDFCFALSGVDLGMFGSRGQSRTAVLALKLAEMTWMRDRSGEWPLLLLDEVLAELDPQRRSDLLQRISGAEQVILTTADLDMVEAEFSRKACVWRVTAGTVQPETPANSRSLRNLQ